MGDRTRPRWWIVGRLLLLLLGLLILPQAGQAGLANKAAILAQNSGLDRDGRELDSDEDEDDEGDEQDDEDEDTAVLNPGAEEIAADFMLKAG